MRVCNRFVFFQAACFFVLLQFFSLPIFAADWARIKEVSGPVSVQTPGESGEAGPLSQVQAGQVVRNGQMLSTSEGGRALLILDDGTTLEILPGSRFVLGDKDEEGGKKSFFTLLAGQIVARVKKLAASDTFQVATPTAIAGVRGTVFAVSVSESGDSHIGVEEGTVAVVDADATEAKEGLILNEKESAESSIGQEPRPTGDFKLNGFRFDAWSDEKKKHLKENLPQVLKAVEKRLEQTLAGIGQSQEMMKKEGLRLMELHEKIETAKKSGRPVPPEMEEHRKKMLTQFRMAGERQKMIGARMQSFAPILGHLAELGKNDPRVREHMAGFRKRTEATLQKMHERRRENMREMEKNQREMKERLGGGRPEQHKNNDKKVPEKKDDRIEKNNRNDRKDKR